MPSENKFKADTSSVPYQGIPIGCGYCAYEANGSGSPIPAIPFAVVVVTKGSRTRQLCEEHARLGGWRPKSHRVSVVSP